MQEYFIPVYEELKAFIVDKSGTKRCFFDIEKLIDRLDRGGSIYFSLFSRLKIV